MRSPSPHPQDGIFLQPSAWSVSSAQLVASQGFPALTVSSDDVGFSLGLKESGSRAYHDAVLYRLASIVQAVRIPVHASLRFFQAPHPEQVAHWVALLIEAGVAGAVFDDRIDAKTSALCEPDHAASRMRAARRAAQASGKPFALTARTDAYLVGPCSAVPTTQGRLASALQRCNACFAAGADGLLVPGALLPEAVGALVKGLGGPLTVLIGASHCALTLPQLGALGVRRAMMGGSLAETMRSWIRKTAAESVKQGTYSYSARSGRANAPFEPAGSAEPDAPGPPSALRGRRGRSHSAPSSSHTGFTPGARGKKAWPTLHMESDRVVVTKWHFEPGARTGHHVHAREHLIVPLVAGTLRLKNHSDVQDLQLQAGMFCLRPAGAAQDVINVNNHEFSFLEIELK